MAAAMLLGSGCGAVGTGGDAFDGSSSGGTQGNPNESIEFLPSSDLTLAPLQVTSVTVEVDPALRQTVTFEILTDADEFDGFLLESQVRVDEVGKATVKLQAPTQSGQFFLRASINESTQAVRKVIVNDQGYGSLKAIPKYAGKRPVGEWTAVAWPDETCETLDSLWSDGALKDIDDEAPTIESVPVGSTIALVLRGEELVSGCATVTGLGADQLFEAEVIVNDRTINTDGGQLKLELDIESTATGFATHLEDAIMLGTSAVRGELASDAVVLLERMKALLTEEELSQFTEAEDAHDLVSATSSVWPSESPLSAQVQSLLTQAATLIPGESAFIGEIELNGATSVFSLQSAAGVPAVENGFEVESTWMVSAETGDTLVFGGTLSYEPLSWLASIAEVHGETSPSTQIQESGMCEEVAGAIFAEVGAAPYDACEQACLKDLCLSALEGLWEEATSVGESLASLQVGITGSAVLGGPAQVVGLEEGTWVGRLEEEETSLKGSARGSAVP